MYAEILLLTGYILSKKAVIVKYLYIGYKLIFIIVILIEEQNDSALIILFFL